MRSLVMTLVVVLLSASPLRGQPEDMAKVLDEARAAFSEGARAMSSDRDAALAAFDRAADLYEQAGAASGFSGELMYNIGTARSLAGDAGRGILWLKRAERVRPNDARVRANLTKARERIGSAAPRSDSFLDQLSLLEFVPAPARLWTAVVAIAATWCLALTRLWSASWRPSRMAIGLAAALGLLAGASLAPREMRINEPSQAVLLLEATGRAGPDSAAYEAKPATPLKAGTELKILEERGSWALGELADGTRTWLEGKALERVRLVRGASGRSSG